MHSRSQCRKQVFYNSFSVATRYQFIITVQVKTQRRITVDDQHHIMSDTAACYIHTTLIPETGHKERGRIDLTATDKSRIIQIKCTDFRAVLVVVRLIVGIADPVIRVSTLRLDISRFIRGIQVHLSKFVRIGDIFRHSKGETEFSRTDGVVTDKENVRVVRILEGLTYFIIIQCLVRNTAIQNSRVQQTGKACCHVSFRVQHFTFYGYFL